jgi:hypothetical protein
VKATKARLRQRVNSAVKAGRLQRPDTLACVDCGHLGNDRKHHYDHYLGYEIEHVFDVQAVCSKCHYKRSLERGEVQLPKPSTHCAAGHKLERDKHGHGYCPECTRARKRVSNMSLASHAAKLAADRRYRQNHPFRNRKGSPRP